MTWNKDLPSGGQLLKTSDDSIRENWTAIEEGNLPFAGTGAQGDILIQTGASAWAHLSPGTDGQFLKTQGSGANPVWADASVLPCNRASGYETVIATGAGTTVATWNIPNDGSHHGAVIYTYFRVTGSATDVSIKIDYTNPTGGAMDITLLDTVNKAVGDYTVTPTYIMCDPSTSVSIKYVAGVANQVYASADLVEVGAG